jgi:hypothetical protein
MRTVQGVMAFTATVEQARECWYDTARWPHWVHGCDQVIAVTDAWPEVGGDVTWRSGPAGRGTVNERVLAVDSSGGLQLAVRDDEMTGRQTVTFTSADVGVEVVLTMEYEITKRSLFTPIVDVLFVARAMRSSLETTLVRFGAELVNRRSTAAGS